MERPGLAAAARCIAGIVIIAGITGIKSATRSAVSCRRPSGGLRCAARRRDCHHGTCLSCQMNLQNGKRNKTKRQTQLSSTRGIRNGSSKVTVMKLSIVAVAAALALSGPAFAQQLNGSTLGQSQPGVNAGVPYPNTTATDNPAPETTERAAPVENGGAKVQGEAGPKPRKTSGKRSAMKASARKTAPAKDKVTPPN